MLVRELIALLKPVNPEVEIKITINGRTVAEIENYIVPMRDGKGIVIRIK